MQLVIIPFILGGVGAFAPNLRSPIRHKWHSGLVARSGGSPLGAGPEGPAAPAAASLRSVKLVLGDGTQLMVAKRKRRVEDEELEGEEGSVATLAGTDGRVVHKQIKQEHTGPTKMQTFIGYATGKYSVLTIFAGMLLVNLLNTGSLNANQNWDDARNRRNAVQDEEGLKTISMLSCLKCGYTIFPAQGRNERFERFTKTCSNCGATDSFYDKNDENDPRNRNPDGTSKVSERRDYMKNWVNADAAQAEKLRQQYNTETKRLGKAGQLPDFVMREIKEKKQEEFEIYVEAKSIEAGEKAQAAALAEGASERAAKKKGEEAKKAAKKSILARNAANKAAALEAAQTAAEMTGGKAAAPAAAAAAAAEAKKEKEEEAAKEEPEEEASTEAPAAEAPATESPEAPAAQEPEPPKAPEAPKKAPPAPTPKPEPPTGGDDAFGGLL